jgi:hypothetical protein
MAFSLKWSRFGRDVIEILVVVGATQQAGPIPHFGLLDVGLNIADR